MVMGAVPCCRCQAAAQLRVRPRCDPACLLPVAVGSLYHVGPKDVSAPLPIARFARLPVAALVPAGRGTAVCQAASWHPCCMGQQSQVPQGWVGTSSASAAAAMLQRSPKQQCNLIRPDSRPSRPGKQYRT